MRTGDIVNTIESIFVHLEERRTAHMAVRNFSLLRPELGLKSLSDGIRTPCGSTVSHQKSSYISGSEDCRLKSVADGSTRFLFFSLKIFQTFDEDVARPCHSGRYPSHLWVPSSATLNCSGHRSRGGLAKDGPFHRLVPGGTPQRFLEVGNVHI